LKRYCAIILGATTCRKRTIHDRIQTFLVTGALGCIGAWTIYHLLKQGERVISFDLYDRGHRLDLLLTPDDQKAVTFVRGDLADFAQVLDAYKAHGITHVIHLAALQVPFCRADPVKGAQVNVVGTVNMFEAARQTRVSHIAYASSIAVYGPPDEYPPGPIAHDAPFAPRTLYGVYKVANEGTARVYWLDHKISSTALRPYTVYGPGRDQGLTSDPTKAMLAAAAGQSFHINFGGRMQFQHASDVALQFIEAARQPLNGAYVFNLGGRIVDIAEIVSLIRRIKPGAQITQNETTLPFPEAFDDTELRQRFSLVYEIPFEEGVRQTIAHFEAALKDGRIKLEAAS
jgi:nucleoside-diphosphate-sugar epimerase